LYFTANDTVKTQLSFTAIEASWLKDRLEECRARRQVLILDCCFSGAFAKAKGAADVDLERQLVGAGRGQVVLTASRAAEYSNEGTPLAGVVTRSVFTAALVDGLRTGNADRNGNGYISVEDAFTYAADQVKATGGEQNPQRWLFGAEGEIILARNPHGPLIIPAELPEPIRQTLDNPYPEIRRGAVAFLGTWLTSAAPDRVLAAQQALQRIASQDSPAVATAAYELLQQTEPSRPHSPSRTTGKRRPAASRGRMAEHEPVATSRPARTAGERVRPWRFTIGGGSPGVVFDGSHIFVTGNDQVVAVDSIDGQPLWKSREFPVASGIAPVMNGDTVLVASADHHLWVLASDTGAVRRRIPLHAEPSAAPTVMGGLPMVPTHDGCLTAVHTDSGRQQWRVRFDQPIFSPVATDGRIFYIAGHDCHVRAWAPDSYRAPPNDWEVWAFRARKWFDASPTIHRNSVFIGGYDGRLHRLDRDHGRERGYWYYQAGGMIKGTAAVSRGTVIFGCYDSYVYGIDILTGQERWPRYHAGDAIKAGVLVHGATIYAASRDGVLHLIDPRTGQGIWQYHVGAPVEVTPIAAGRLVVVGDSNGVVHAIGT
jgi:outer membrane protein assembly factor BamB